MATGKDELKCGICLELFQDPRSLPCLHTFCRECIQRSLNETDHSLKCPVCRAKHEVNEEGAGLLPVNQYALQELQQRREDSDGQQAECKSCGEQAPVVAWCEDCDAMICQQCLSQHKKLLIFRDHLTKPFKKFKNANESIAIENGDSTDPASEKQVMFSKCPTHGNERLKFLCTICSELVCSDCLLLGSHREHSNRLVEGARHSLETKMEELAIVTENKKQELTEFLVKAVKAEHEAIDYSELMETKVNNIFDGIMASVEAQRNEALQSVSQGKKEIWAQKEMVEVSLAQLDSFTRFADHTHKCMAEASYVGMAAQGIKLMERLKDIHGDEATLNQKIHIGSRLSGDNSPLQQPLCYGLFSLGQPSLNFLPTTGSVIPNLSPGMNTIRIKVSLVAGELPVLFPPIHIDGCKLTVVAVYQNKRVKVRVRQADQSSWDVVVGMVCNEDLALPLCIRCQLLGAVTIEAKAMYTIRHA